ncbi:MAG: SDR family oxidoreductase [Alphaproteobacteria bacterium]|nr:SDR family oxidoreductase [Alphaproteobacteria bacterium]
MIEPKDLDFTGRRVLVTGGASGIGRAMAHAFKGHGASLILADRNAEGLAQVAGELGGDVQRHVYDQGDIASVQKLADAAGPVDVLCNNAGISGGWKLVDTTPEQIQEVITVNLIGPIVLARAIALSMLARGKGVIVNTSSQLAFNGAEERGAYAAAKAGIAQFTRTAGIEWGRRGVRVVAIGPGRTITPMTMRSSSLGDPVMYEKGLDRIPVRRYGKPEEIANIVLFLASDVAGYVVGETLVADGGYNLI